MDVEKFTEKLPFAPYDYQQDYLEGIYKAQDKQRNYLITLPTGCGKSVGFEYCANAGKTIYTVPIRALANEKLEEMPELYPNLSILRDTGQDYGDREGFDYVNQDVIITTNERLLSIINNKVKEDVFAGVKYIVFDEIHMISDITRGSTLEWIIMLLKRFHPDIMIVGLSATLPNYTEFADWLDADYTWLPNEKRPIPLEFHFGTPLSWKANTQAKKREEKFNQLIKYTVKFKEQFLVFMSSKRSIEDYAKQFAMLPNGTLDQLMEKGVAFHHADISEFHKKDVLDRFKSGEIRVIFCSPTLAVGVNLPATNCVIFDVSFWNDIAFYFEPLPADKLTQMFGRAGRVGYSDVGRVIILGTQEEIDISKWHISNPSDTNSQFGRVIVDKILSMIATKVAKNIDEIMTVIEKSFLHHQNNNINVDIIKDAVELLMANKFIITDDGVHYRPTKRGYMTIKLMLPVHTIIDAVTQLRKLKGSLKDIKDIYKIFLANQDFLGNISYEDKPQDKKLVQHATSFFGRDANPLWVNVYDKDTNSHVPIEKLYAYLKAMAIMFKDDVLPKKYKLLTQDSTIWKMRREASGLVSRISIVLQDELEYVFNDKDAKKYFELSIRFGTMNSDTLELFSMEGVGQKTIEKLLIAGIKSRKEFMATSEAKLKALGVRNIKSILKTYADERPKVNKSLDDYF